ncbi:MAG: hypothetical protein WEF86_05885 [Gemmatimonadota bacterium]
MRSTRTAALLVIATALMSACDRTPVDPAVAAIDAARLLFGDDAAALAPVPLSLSGLLQSALLKAYTEHGPAAARGLVMDLRRLQQLEQAAAEAGAGELAAAHRQELHAEQLGIVLRVLGDEIIDSAIVVVRSDVDRTATRIGELPDDASAAGARRLLEHAVEMLQHAAAARQSGAHHAALDAVTRAASAIESVHEAVRESQRVAGLADLFADAVRSGAANLAIHEQLAGAARTAVIGADREGAHSALSAVRNEEIRIVVRAFGSSAVERMLDQVDIASARLRSSLDSAGERGRDITRVERMDATVCDLTARARAALRAGDAAQALDLGAHAVGLVNAARLAADPL